jgi:hypothetical protein
MFRTSSINSCFTTGVTPGRLALQIVLDPIGADTLMEEVVSQVIHFPRVVIKSLDFFGDIFTQNRELVELIRKATKQRQDIFFELHTFGTEKPNGLSAFKNVQYNVNIFLKNTGLSMEKRLVAQAINYFNEADANFIFDIMKSDDIDEVNTIVISYGIKKHNVFLKYATVNQGLHALIKISAKTYGYNIVQP